MTRVHHGRLQRAPNGGMPLDQPRAAVRKKKPYKIVLEAVTQEKKKLHSILTYASNAPNGFGFVPAGHPEFTEWCKEQCRQRNLDVHIVSAKPKNKMHADPEKLSHHVHRVGHHFPLEIVNLACSKFGYVYDEAQGLLKDKSRERRTNWIAQGVEDYSSRQLLHGRPTTEKESKEHTRGAVREMFPKIPEADLDSIVNHAFEEGTNRVGNAKELSLARRVQLAVVAHIRHVYTDYDKMLKTGTWMQARQNVEHVSLAKLKEWRDEAGEQSNEIEDTFREVIVLDDDDDSSDEGSLSTPDEREQSMEIVSSRATARDLQPERHVDHSRVDVYNMRRVPKRTIMAQPYMISHSASLYAPLHGQPLAKPVSVHPTQRVLRSSARPLARDEAHDLVRSQPINLPARPPPPHTISRAQQPLMQEIDGRMYHVSVEIVEPSKRDIKLEPIRESYVPPRRQHQPESFQHAAPSYAQDEYVYALPEANSHHRPSAHPPRRPSEQDVVLPSVERETLDLTSPRLVNHGQPVNADFRPAPRGYVAIQPPKRKSFPSFADDRESHSRSDLKRPRSLYYEDDLTPHAGVLHSARPAHATNDARSQFRAQPPQDYIDLTSSPRRPPTNGGNGYHVPMYPHAVPDSNGHSYVPADSRRTPIREMRGPHHEINVGESPREYVHSSGMYERRGPPPRDYIPVRDEQYPRPVKGGPGRYLESALPYGGPDVR